MTQWVIVVISGVGIRGLFPAEISSPLKISADNGDSVVKWLTSCSPWQSFWSPNNERFWNDSWHAAIHDLQLRNNNL